MVGELSITLLYSKLLLFWKLFWNVIYFKSEHNSGSFVQHFNMKQGCVWSPEGFG